MDLFDSATPVMKRMRNQKKDGTILEQMLATARDTEPAEISYHPNGDFRASRDIFGPLSTENSPVGILPTVHLMEPATDRRIRRFLARRNAGPPARQLQPCPMSASTLLVCAHHEERRLRLFKAHKSNNFIQCLPHLRCSSSLLLLPIRLLQVLVVVSFRLRRKTKNSG